MSDIVPVHSISSAITEENWEAFKEIMEKLCTYDSEPHEKDRQYWQVIMFTIILYKQRHDVLEFLVKKGWPVDLDELERIATIFELTSSLEAIQRMRLLSVGGNTNND